MPPAVVRCVRDLIFWQYAKIISESAGAGKRQYGFVMDRFKKLTSGEIQWSTSIREYVKEREKAHECIYCGAKKDLTVEHILPRSRGGLDTTDKSFEKERKGRLVKEQAQVSHFGDIRFLRFDKANTAAPTTPPIISTPPKIPKFTAN